MTKIIILAAGKGTRMGSDLPKVLVPLNGRPMISYLMDSVVSSEVDVRPIVVVSPDNKDIIAEALKDYNVDFAVQDRQLGTGHAVSCALPFVPESADKVLVLYGDHPFLKSDSIKLFASLNPQAVTIMPAVLPDFDDWRQNFYHWGRIIRGADGNVERIVEFKDASDEEKMVTEVNPGFMCFNKNWLMENISRLRDDNNNKEYYLTDMVKIAFEENFSVSTSGIEAHEAMGVNSPDELSIAENLLR